VVLNYNRITADDLAAVVRHELGHVVTLLGSAGGRGYLGEGMAEYIAHEGEPVTAYNRLGSLRRYLAGGAWNGDIDSADATVYSEDLTASAAAYAIGFLTLRCIAERHGDTATFEFFDQTVRNAKPPASVALSTLGATWPDTKRDCANYLRTIAG
jgi:hypothetical protein